MAANARVCWHVTPEPWITESALIGQLSLPLNLDQNAAGPFHTQLSERRAYYRARARTLPVVTT
jgi:hypothetical protein